MPRRLRSPRSSGFALPATLLLLTLLTILVIGFLSTARIERRTAKAYRDIQVAELAAMSAVASGTSRIVTAIRETPYNATGYRTVVAGKDGSSPTAMTVPIIAGVDLASGAQTDTYLVSTPSRGEWPGNLPLDEMVDLNVSNRMGAKVVGAADPPEPSPAFVPWIEILENPNLPMDPKTNPVIARYAFWIEDETSKLDYRRAGYAGSDGGFDRTARPYLHASQLDLGALPLRGNQPLTRDEESRQINWDILNFRNSLPLLDPKFINRASPLLSESIYDDAIKFYGTIFSRSNELAFTGKRRVNLNQLVTNTRPLAERPNSPIEISGQIDVIAKTIRDAIPSFGQRFLNPGAPAAQPGALEDRYLLKLAANIRDYIDADSQPTIVDGAGSVLPAGLPSEPWPPGEEPQAVGQEAVPRLVEFGWRGQEVTWDATAEQASYVVEMDYYFEFANVSTKDFIAPEGTFLRVTNRPSWNGGTGGDLLPPDFQLALGGRVFPAGQSVVVTTDPDPDAVLGDSENPVMSIPPSEKARRFEGVTTLKEGGRPALKFEGRSGAADYETRIVWGSPEGYYGSYAFVGMEGEDDGKGGIGGKDDPKAEPEKNDGSPFDFTGEHVGEPAHYVTVSALSGEDRTGYTGDPRSLFEPIGLTAPAADGEESSLPFEPTSGLASLGEPGSPFADPTTWPDYNPNPNGTAATAPAILADREMESIGELGHIYDPARDSDPSVAGGGRTLNIGRPDPLAVGDRFGSAWQRNAWRLTDLFSTSISLLPTEEPTRSGKININGVMRDDGVVLRAALREQFFAPEPESDPSLAGRVLTEADIDDFVASVHEFLRTNGPMMERGELSSISFFAENPPNGGHLTGATVSPLNDRGREELFRRVVELIATRSASFTVNAVGQAVHQLPDGTRRILSQRWLRQTIEILPEIGDGLDDEVTGYRVNPLYSIWD